MIIGFHWNGDSDGDGDDNGDDNDVIRSGRSGGGEVVVKWWWFEVQDAISVFFYVLRFDKKVLTLERFQKWMGGRGVKVTTQKGLVTKSGSGVG